MGAKDGRSGTALEIGYRRSDIGEEFGVEVGALGLRVVEIKN